MLKTWRSAWFACRRDAEARAAGSIQKPYELDRLTETIRTALAATDT